MATHEFRLPDVGEGVAEGELIEWRVEVGEPVTENQPIAEVETDKAAVELPSPVDGTVAELRAQPGDIVPVGDVLVVFDVEDSMDGSAPPPTESVDEEHTRAVAAPSARRQARELGVDIDGLAGTGPGGRITEADVRSAAQTDADDSQPAQHTSDTQTTRQADESTAEPPREKTLAVPATRALAEELGVDIDAIPPTEYRDGTAFVSESAVRNYATEAASEAEPTGVDTEADQPESAQATADEPAPGVRVPYRGTRRTIGQRMQQSKFTAPHATHHDLVDATELVSLRERLAPVAEERGFGLTYTPIFCKALAAVLPEFPLMNARLDEAEEEIVCHDEYHIGVAVNTPSGLVVPVVEDVDVKSLATVASELESLVERARERRLDPDELQGSTFTLTNPGRLGGEFATPIINYPEVAILGTGAIRKRPWVVDEDVEARDVLPLSVSFDHRVIDGAVVAEFVTDLKTLLRDPTRLMLE